MSKILDKNCILCSLFVSCKDIKKSHKHVCGEYQPYNKKKIEKALASPKIEGNKKKNSKIDNGEAITAEKQKSDFSEFNNAAFNFENLVNETIENETRNPIAPDIRIDDRDLPMAKNFLEFCSPKFLNYKAWPKQIEIGSHLFAEICPKCSDMDYANDIPKKDTRKQIKNHVVFLEYGVCPECNSRRSKMFKRGQLKVPNELVGLAGQRAAKTTTSVALAAYITHRALKLQNAPLAYGQLESTTLHGVMAALTAQQAAQNIWQPFVNLLQDSPWYTEYFKLMNYYSNKYGEEIYKFKDTFLHFRSRRLLIYPRGPDKKTMRGRTGLFCILDELGWFDSDASKNKIKDNADEVYTALNNSLRTIKSAARKVLRKGVDSIVQPCMISISSPSNKKDMICRLVEKAKDSDTMHWFHYASWEMNKDLDRRDFDSDFKNDYAKAMRDFAAVPPNSSFPFFSELKHVKHIFKANIPNIVKFKQEIFRQNKKDYTGSSVSISASTNNPKRLLAIDAGYNNNSFAIVGGYMHPELGTVLDIFGEITPSKEAPANFTAIASDVIIPIIEQCGVVVLAADRWQSTKLLQDIESNFEELQTIVHSVKYKDFISYKEDLLNENIVVPKLEGDIKDCLKMGNDDEYPHSFKRKPMLHFAYQLVTVQDLKKEVTKGENSTDDLFRASVLAHRLINDPDLAELLEGEIVGATKNNGVLGVWGSKGTGGGSSSSVSVNGIATVGFINRR